MTPKVGTAAAALREGKLLLIRRADNGHWAPPGGWAEVDRSPAENILKELKDETGFDGSVEGLLGVFDNRRFGSKKSYQIYTLLFRAPLVGGVATTSHETTAVEFFAAEQIPGDLTRLHRALVECALANPRDAVFQ